MNILSFTHNDLDGRASAAIIYKKFGDIVKFVECDYKNLIDISTIKPNDKVIITDFSFPPEIMEKVLSITQDIIWIDHHKTALDYKYSKLLKGIRDIKFSGCELTWQYLFPDENIPVFITLIGDMDKWAWKYENTALFTTGMLLYDQKPNALIWKYLFEDWEHDIKTTIHKVISDGNTCINYRDNLCKEYVNKYGFETNFEEYKCYALGLAMFGSIAFGDKVKEYDILLSFEFDGVNWSISLYSEKENIDVGKLAQKFGGGGHKGAAGFTIKELPFKKK